MYVRTGLSRYRGGLGDAPLSSGVAMNPTAPPLSFYGIPADAVRVASNLTQPCGATVPSESGPLPAQAFYSASTKAYYCGPAAYSDYSSGTGVVSSPSASSLPSWAIPAAIAAVILVLVTR